MAESSSRSTEAAGSTTADPVPDELGAGDLETYRPKDERRRRRTRKHQARLAGSTTPSGETDAIVFVYEPHVRYVPPLVPYVRELWRCRGFAIELARSTVKGGHSRTALGGLWAILDPIFMICIYFFMFSTIREGSRPDSFVPSLISGVLHWQLTATALAQGSSSVSNAKSLMLNSTFPRMLLPLSSIYTGVLRFLPSIPVIFLTFIVVDVPITGYFLWWIPVFTMQILIGLGLALLLSTAVVFFADVKNLVSYITRIMFFTSPIIFPAGFLPDRAVSILQWLPFFGIFDAYQRVIAGTAPDLGVLAIGLGWMMIGLVLGSWLFLRYEREFASRM